MFKNEYVLSVDIKKSMTTIVPFFVQYDTASLVFKIYDNGKPFDLTGFTGAEISHKLIDGTSIIGFGSLETLSNGTKVIRYNYSGNEMSQPGTVSASLSVYSSNKKVSILPFKVEIVDNTYEDSVPADSPELNLLQQLIVNVSTVSDQATQAVTNITQAVTQANNAIANANQAITNTNQAIASANAAATNANDNATLANIEATNANEKASLANQAAIDANQAATNANEKANLADEKAGLANLAAINANEKTGLVNQVITDANLAVINANQAATNANQATVNATQAATEANQAATEISQAITNAKTEATNANDKATLANNAATSANASATLANQATSNANQATANVNAARDATVIATNNAQAIADNTRSVGTFSLSTTYLRNNIVTSNGSSWIALTNTQNNPLPVLPITQNTWWRLLAEKGADGNSGGTGTVTKINSIEPDEFGNVTLTPTNLGAASIVHTHTTAQIAGLDTALSTKYVKPTNGIPSSDLTSSVQTSLTKADSALQSVADASTSAKGIVQLNNTLTSTSTSQAVTAAQAKVLNDNLTSHISDTIKKHIEIVDEIPANLEGKSVFFNKQGSIPSAPDKSNDITAHETSVAPHQYGGKFEWRYNPTTNSLDLVVLD